MQWCWWGIVKIQILLLSVLSRLIRTGKYVSNRELNFDVQRDLQLNQTTRPNIKQIMIITSTCRHQVNYQKGKAKSEFYVNMVNENRNKPKKLWQALTSLGTSSKHKTKSGNIGLMINDVMSFDKAAVSEHFNIFLLPLPLNLLICYPKALVSMVWIT